jgi:curved DNA-binding protein CbpA
MLKESRRLERESSKFLESLGIDEAPSASYFKVLGIRPTEDQKRIRAAYVSKMRKYHPDVNASEDSQETAKELNEAYHFLSKKGNFSVSMFTPQTEEKVKKAFIEMYLEERKKDLERLEKDVANSKDSFTAEAYVGNFNAWEKRFRKVWNGRFGRLYSLQRSTLKLKKRMDKALEGRLDQEEHSMLKENASSIAELASLQEDAERFISSIRKELEASIGDMERKSKASVRY